MYARKITTQPTAAHAWFEQHLPELQSRARCFVHRFPARHRPDAIAEILGQAWRYVRNAALRGKLDRLTPPTLVYYFGGLYAGGRRLCGPSSTDVLSTVCRQRHGLRVVSLDQPRCGHTHDGGDRLPLSQVLADRRAPSPLEDCRVDLDYGTILARQQVSHQMRRVFNWLASTKGAGRQIELARLLRVSPPRVTQIKKLLAARLAAEGYGPRLRIVRPRSKRRSRGKHPHAGLVGGAA
jgi:hypothetical protein